MTTRARQALLAALAGLALLAPALAQSQEPGSQGQAIFEQHCADCHRSSGLGLPPTFPALKGNDVVLGPPKPLIETVLHGRRGETASMPAWQGTLSSQEIAAVLTYVRAAWGNNAPAITVEQVQALSR